MKGICQKSDVRGVTTIPWSVLSKSPPKALSSYLFIKLIPTYADNTYIDLLLVKAKTINY